MKSRKKKDKSSVMDSHTEAFDSIVDELAEAVMEELNEKHSNALEPFEQYAQNVRSKLHGDLDAFRSRFVRGYHSLLEELSQEHKQQVKQSNHNINDSQF